MVFTRPTGRAPRIVRAGNPQLPRTAAGSWSGGSASFQRPAMDRPDGGGCGGSRHPGGGAGKNVTIEMLAVA